MGSETLRSLIGIVALFCLATVCFTLMPTSCTSGYDWQQAEKDAKQFSEGIPETTGKVVCTKTDSDGDGYCSCSVFKKDGQIIPLDCGCEKFCMVCARGCKLSSPIKVLRTNQTHKPESEL